MDNHDSGFADRKVLDIMTKCFRLLICIILVSIFSVPVWHFAPVCAEGTYPYTEYSSSTDLKATFKMDFPTLLERMNSKFRELGYSEYELPSDSWVEQNETTESGNQFTTYMCMNAVSLVSISVDAKTNKVYGCIVGSLNKDAAIAAQIRYVYCSAFMAAILDTDLDTAYEWMRAATNALNDNGNTDKPAFWNGIVFQINEFYMIMAVDKKSYPELAEVSFDFYIPSESPSDADLYASAGVPETVVNRALSGQEAANTESKVLSALMKVGFDEKYTGSFGEMLNLVVTNIEKKEIKETRQRGLFTYYLKFQFINAYNVYMELKATNRDVLEMMGPEGFGLLSEGELYIYYDSVNNRIMRIENSGDIYSALELACISKKLLNVYSSNIDLNYQRGVLGTKSPMKEYELDSEGAPLVEQVSESIVLDSLKERYSEDIYQLLVVDNDNHNRFIVLVKDVATEEYVKTIYVCFDKWGVDFDTITLTVGGFDTKYDVLPGDTADDLIDKIRSERNYYWGKPAWVGNPAAAKYFEGIEKRNKADWDGAVKAFTEAGDYKDAQLMVFATRYDEGVTKLASGDMDGALQAFEAAGDYSDAKDKRNAVYYDKGIEKKASRDWEDAIALFGAVGDYKDAKLLILESYFAEGEEKRQAQDWEGAVQAYKSAGEFNNASDLIKQTRYEEGESKLLLLDWDGAIKAFEAAGDYRDAALMAKKVKYQKADHLEQLGQQQEAKELFASLGNYEDSHDRAYKPYYDLGLSLYEKQDWEGAVAAFIEAEDYGDAKSRISATYYAAGEAKFAANDWEGAIEAYEKAGDFSDAKTMIKAVIYKEAESLAEQGKIAEAKKKFLGLGNYKDANDRAYKLYYDLGVNLRAMQDWDGAIAAFVEAGSYSDAADQIKETYYLHAKKLNEIGDYDAAYEIFSGIRDYKDVMSLIQADSNLLKIYLDKLRGERNQYLHVGNIVKFGRYEQDNDLDNGPEDIEWIVLESKKGKTLLLSRYGLDAKAFCDTDPGKDRVWWEDATLRTWLNNEFFLSAFSSEERKAIVLTEVINGRSQNQSDSWNGNDTLDYLFLLSYREAYEMYLQADSFRICVPTKYAIENGAVSQSMKGKDDWGSYGRYESAKWWLRSSGNSHVEIALASPDYPYDQVDIYKLIFTVRPAMWVDVSIIFPELYENGETKEIINDDFQHDIETGTKIESEQTETALTNESVPEGTVIATQTTDEPAMTSWQQTSVQAGGRIAFGSYEQDCNTGNGTEPITWIVLEIQGNKALLLSKYILDVQPYHKEKRDITWENCSLRNWLNNVFLNAAFTAEERTTILLTEVDNGYSQRYSGWDGKGGNNTKDYLYLLSYMEAYKYFGLIKDANYDNVSAKCAPTAYALQHGVFISPEVTVPTEEGRMAGAWWLRSPGNKQSAAAGVGCRGNLGSDNVSTMDNGIRPCFWLDLNMVNVVAGNVAVAASVTEEVDSETGDGSGLQESDTSQINFYVYTVKSTNVRERPDKNSALYWKFPDSGVCVEVLDTVVGVDGKSWYKLKLPNNMTGYARYDFFGEPIYANVAAYTETYDEEEDSYVSGSYPMNGLTNRENVNIREKMNKNSKLLLSIPKKGTSVTLLTDFIGDDGLVWYRVEYNDVKGYIRSDFITIGN